MKNPGAGTNLNKPWLCRTCGHVFEQGHTNSKQYCSDPCRNFWKYLRAAERELEKINLDPVHRKMIKGELFAIANSIRG